MTHDPISVLDFALRMSIWMPLISDANDVEDPEDNPVDVVDPES